MTTCMVIEIDYNRDITNVDIDKKKCQKQPPSVYFIHLLCQI